MLPTMLRRGCCSGERRVLTNLLLTAPWWQGRRVPHGRWNTHKQSPSNAHRAHVIATCSPLGQTPAAQGGRKRKKNVRQRQAERARRLFTVLCRRVARPRTGPRTRTACKVNMRVLRVISMSVQCVGAAETERSKSRFLLLP